MPVDATLVTDSPRKPGLDASLTSSAMAESGLNVDFRTNALMERDVKYFVRIFNISKMGFSVDTPFFRAWQNSNNIPACPPDKPYIEVARFADVVIEKYPSGETGQIQTRGERGERIAMDIINPANLGIDQDQIISPNVEVFSGGGSCDLGKRGVFFVVGHETPREEDIRKAKARMEKFYRLLINQAEELSRTGHRTSIGIEMHVAADYFKLRSDWHTVATLPDTCENCGQDIATGLPFHVIAGGIICVRDWRKAVESGVKQYADVPEEKRWRTEPEVEPQGQKNRR